MREGRVLTLTVCRGESTYCVAVMRNLWRVACSVVGTCRCNCCAPLSRTGTAVPVIHGPIATSSNAASNTKHWWSVHAWLVLCTLWKQEVRAPFVLLVYLRQTAIMSRRTVCGACSVTGVIIIIGIVKKRLQQYVSCHARCERSTLHFAFHCPNYILNLGRPSEPASQ